MPPGASSGIGAGAAIHLASLGCRLALNGRNEENLKAVVNECTAAGALHVFPVVAALDDVVECERVIEDTINHFGRLDVLVNNAGIVIVGGIQNVSVDDFDRQMNVNLRSVFILIKLAIPHLLKVKGNIVNISSVAGLRAFTGVVCYCMSKAALDHLTRCVALEFADQGVRVNAVNPGVVVTNIFKRSGMSEKEYEKLMKRCEQSHALGRPGTVDEVAKAIAFLASDDSSFITGETIAIDGGRHAMCPS